MQLTDDTLLAATSGITPLVHLWPTEAVVFNPASAETHLLSLPAASVLQSVMERSQSLHEARSSFNRIYGPSFPDGGSETYLLETVEQLIELDLIELHQGTAP